MAIDSTGKKVKVGDIVLFAGLSGRLVTTTVHHDYGWAIRVYRDTDDRSIIESEKFLIITDDVVDRLVMKKLRS